MDPSHGSPFQILKRGMKALHDEAFVRPSRLMDPHSLPSSSFRAQDLPRATQQPARVVSSTHLAHTLYMASNQLPPGLPQPEQSQSLSSTHQPSSPRWPPLNDYDSAQVRPHSQKTFPVHLTTPQDRLQLDPTTIYMPAYSCSHHTVVLSELSPVAPLL